MSKFLAVIGMIILILVLVAAGAAFAGWLVMLLFGILHSVWPDVPAIAFWPQAFWIGFIINILFGGGAKASAN